ncbi:hypothetical protein SAMN04490243_0670 [Robiginitalea myxolifaciens]|uniref:DUF4097 domain-containing protein n=1 Tax=Robiginitalea myxolifaciens TaxID=400055 RepID=A0A1I6FUC9_9FLAO|nr:DUF4097 family beta strand repeat-containing protein [Robiginitalea myxolifaciens]SFR33417.1 hypothetical protein SAMN04490243_0670 [Robiginitalea myxolifaciens]
MKFYKFILATCLVLAIAPAGAQQLEKREVISRELSFPSGSNELEVWNLNGSVTVEAYPGSVILIEVERIVKAEQASNLEAGFAEIDFEATRLGDKAVVRMTGPCVKWGSESENPWDLDPQERKECNRDRGYSYIQNFRVKVPQATNLKVSTVNQGEVMVRGLRGATLQAGNVNGGITLEDVTGKTKVNAINGAVKISYHANPDKGSSFYSLNGDVTVQFREDLSAEIGFESMNGEIYTDFEIRDQYTRTETEDRGKNKKGRYKYVAKPVIRIGSGAVMHEFETLNGNVYVKKI